jgi:RNA polymerase sigma factor (sigma-70 family)
MASGQLGPVLEHIRQLLTSRSVEGLSDGQLLHHFIAHRDETAFAALLQRHGPMVLGVCRRVLRQAHDVDDAFQATFLVLIRKASSISRHEMLGSWLYGVAYRVAVRSKTNAAKRRAREQQVVPSSAQAAEATVPAGALHREECQVLDEELQHLPEKYRAPLVLHYLEGKTKEETARRLGWKEGTVAGRLVRARRMLEGRLARRGVGGSLAMLLAASAAQALPAPLAHVTQQAAVRWAAGGPVAAELARSGAYALATQALTRLAPTRLVAAAAVLATGLLAAGIGLRPGASGTDKPVADKSPRAPLDTAPAVGPTPPVPPPRVLRSDPQSSWRLSARGRVVDERNRPIKDVMVYLREWGVRREAATGARVRDVLVRAQTDAVGRFVLPDIGAPRLGDLLTMRQHPWDLVVVAPGRGLAWQQLTPHAQRQTLEIKLQPEVRLEGRVVDKSGRPVAGAMVCACGVAPLDKYLEAPASQWAGAARAGNGSINLYHSQIAPTARSDAKGHFVLAGLPAQMRCTLHITSANHVDQVMYAATTRESVPNVLDTGYRPQPVQHGTVRVTLEAGHLVRGRVLAADTNKPLPAAEVKLLNPVRMAVFKAAADSEGRYSFAHIPAGSYTLSFKAGTQAYLPVQGMVQVPRTGKPEFVYRLPRGTLISGRIVDAETGQGIAGAYVSCLANAEVVDGLQIQSPTTQTDRQGCFQMAVPPGQRNLLALAENLGCGYLERTTQMVDIKRGRPQTDLKLALRPSPVLAGQVLDPAGAPVAGARVAVERLGDPGVAWQAVVTDLQGRFRLTRLAVAGPYMCVATHRGRKLGGRTPVCPTADGKPPGPVAIRLGPLGAVAGRLLTPNGRPVAGAAITIRVNPKTTFGFRVPAVVPEAEGLLTDARGQFRFDELVPATERAYFIEAAAPGCVRLQVLPFQARPGQTHQLGDLVMVGADQELAGRVVDRRGRPCADVPVTARPTGRGKTGETYLGPDPVVTGADGRFRITGLPRGPVELRARDVQLFAGKRAARRLVASSPLTVQAGRQDVVILLNPDP